MTKAAFFLLLVLLAPPQLFDMAAYGQWPLGKDLSAGTVKSGESSGYLIGSGRFQVFVSPNVKGHTFMLDTETGRIWIFKKDSTSGDLSLQRIPVDQLNEIQNPGATHPGK